MLMAYPACLENQVVLTDFTPLTALGDRTALSMSPRELTNPVSWTRALPRLDIDLGD